MRADIAVRRWAACRCLVFVAYLPQLFRAELRLLATNVAVINAFARLDQRVRLYADAGSTKAETRPSS